jgi:alkylation response protein AidB-like acyl-CoA dehydrogenase
MNLPAVGRESKEIAACAASHSAAEQARVADRLVEALFEEAALVDVDEGFPRHSLDLLRQSGLLAAPVAAELGGGGLAEAARLRALLEVLAHLGRGSLPVGRIYEGHVNALLLIQTYGTVWQVQRAATDARQGHLFAVWNTEAADGVRCVEGGDRLVLEGCKTFATAAGFASRAVITLTLPNGERQMALLNTDTSKPRLDTSFWRPLGMRATASYKADFTGAAITSDALLGQPGDYYREPVFSTGALRFAAVQLGGIEAVFDATRSFLRSLGRTEDPYQRGRLGEIAMLAASGRHWLVAAAEHRLPAADVAFSHLMRTAIETIGLRVLQLAERSVGARGLLRPATLERLHRDLTHYLRQGAPDAVLAAAGTYVVERDESSAWLWRNEDDGDDAGH